MSKKFIVIGLIFVTIGIILGAMGAHYLETIGIQEAQIDSFKTGTQYLFYNGLGSLALAGIVDKFDFSMSLQFHLITWGTVCFSGSIFALVLLPKIGVNINAVLGPITPIGGLLMILGWGITMASFLRTYRA